MNFVVEFCSNSLNGGKVQLSENEQLYKISCSLTELSMNDKMTEFEPIELMHYSLHHVVAPKVIPELIRGLRGNKKGETTSFDNFSYLVIPFGFEPKTYCLEGSCSIQLSYGTVMSNKKGR